ncbi:MAG: glycoside hydrolase family 88 protein [Deltaproteobacteria bacterium]|nr:glycoside hydrolase family 88 protein [Deltaproteobacteria bacterium]
MNIVRRAAVLAILTASFVACSNEPADPASPTCTPSTPSSTDAFARAHAPDSPEIALARAIADRWLAVHPPEKAAWDWGDGVQLGALMELHRVTGEPRYRDHVKRFLDAQIAAGYEIVTSDRCPPVLSALALYGQTCDAKYRKVVDDMQRYLEVDALRTDDGGINHFGTVRVFGASLWIDSLYMFGQVLIRRGEAWNDAPALDLYGSQYRVFAKHLQDAATGFFVHAYHWSGQDPNVFWARGNGWVVASAADYLRVRAARGESDAEVRTSFLRLVQAVVAAQDPKTGLFWTVLNRPGETYLETSATALFALGLARARRAGVLDATALDPVNRAMDGVRSRIVNDSAGRPVVTGISGPTTAGSFKRYAAVPLEDDVHYGVGAVILALIEVAGLT